MATSKKTAKKAAPKKKEPRYSLTVSINGEDTLVKGDDILAILQAYPQPAAIKTNMFVTVTDGVKTAEHIVAIRDARRTFDNPTKMTLLAKNLGLRLG